MKEKIATRVRLRYAGLLNFYRRRPILSGLLTLPLLLLLLGFLIPESYQMPVRGADKHDWNHKTFWHYPWGASGVHKGIDIFASGGRPVVSAVHGIVLSNRRSPRGGTYVVVLGPKWRIHYYAHLGEANARPGTFLAAGDVIGTVGTSGNARGKQPHLHYSILSLIPYPWNLRPVRQGWKRMFFLNPHRKLIKLG